MCCCGSTKVAISFPKAIRSAGLLKEKVIWNEEDRNPDSGTSKLLRIGRYKIGRRINQHKCETYSSKTEVSMNPPNARGRLIACKAIIRLPSKGGLGVNVGSLYALKQALCCKKARKILDLKPGVGTQSAKTIKYATT
jgi:hypothetical protein